MIVLGDLEKDPIAHWANIEAGGSRLIVVEGVWPKVCPHADPTECNGEHCDCPLRIPPDLVAATEPCRTCDGRGYRWRNDDGEVILGCPDCHDGRPKIEVWTECQHPPEADFMGYACDACGAYNGSGDTILLGHVTVEAVLPIVDGSTAVADRGPRLVLYPESRILRRSPQSHPPFLDHELTHYDPERIVGKFGVLIAAVAE